MVTQIETVNVNSSVCTKRGVKVDGKYLYVTSPWTWEDQTKLHFILQNFNFDDIN